MPPIGIGYDGEPVALARFNSGMARAHADLRMSLCLCDDAIAARAEVARIFRAGRDANAKRFAAVERDIFLATHDARVALAQAATNAALADLRRAAR